jgi:hypothetical protein
VTKTFLKKSGLQMVVRAHEMCPKGFKWHFRAQSVLTVFSSCHYCQENNDGAVAVCSAQSALDFVVFHPLEGGEEPERQIDLPNCEAEKPQVAWRIL